MQIDRIKLFEYIMRYLNDAQTRELQFRLGLSSESYKLFGRKIAVIDLIEEMEEEEKLDQIVELLPVVCPEGPKPDVHQS